jgi:hypothetical protein
MAGDGAEGALKRCPAKRKADEEAAPGCSEAKAVVAAPSRPPSRNMMPTERVEYLLNCKSQPYHRTGKIDPVADRYDELAKELEENREQLRKEFEEKGYVYVPDGYEEEIHRCNDAAFKSAYLEVYGCLPPEDGD